MTNRRVLACIILVGLVGGIWAAWELRPHATATVPDVTGSDPTKATRALESAGFEVRLLGFDCLSTISHGDEIRREVIEQHPAPGTIARRGSLVQGRIQVSDFSDPSRILSCTGTFRSTDPGPGIGFIAFFLAPIALAFVAAADMGNRGERGWLWGFFVLFLFPFGLPVWLLFRRTLPIRPESRGGPRPGIEVWGPPPAR